MGLSTKDIAWAAGFIEGEGTFVHIKPTSKWDCSYQDRIDVWQVNKAPLLKLQQLFGGNIRIQKEKSEVYQSL